MAGSLVQFIIAHFDSVFKGPNGDYAAVLEAVDEVTAAQALWKPAPAHNSIWQIVDHLSASNIWQIEVLEKGQAAPPVWTEPAGDEKEWQTSLARLKETQLQLKAALGQLSDQELFSIPDPEWGKTQLELLLSTAAHQAHHSGQIDYLKGLQIA